MSSRSFETFLHLVMCFSARAFSVYVLKHLWHLNFFSTIFFSFIGFRFFMCSNKCFFSSFFSWKGFLQNRQIV
uniref:Putative secreted protein n=1 Tax=Psorophora albipes TaxID=869069 RepID=T1D5X7_9DIPT